MTELLITLFVKDADNAKSPVVRERFGRLAGVVGIVSNLLLFLAKLAIGYFSHSISIMADAVNNLSDCASSAITLIAFKLSGMPADEEHPYGHARFEYISGLVVSFLILLIGWEFLVSSFQKILAPEPVQFSWAVAAVLALSICVKLWQGIFNRSIGRRIDSATLAATAADSRNDAITTMAVLLGAAVAHLTGLNLDGYFGLLVAAFILWSGVGLVRDTIDPLLGMAPDPELVCKIQEKILSCEGVVGMHDLVVHNYGPGRCFASVHIEVPAEQDIMFSHDIVDEIEREFMSDMGIELVGHMDPIVTDDARTSELRLFIEKAAREIDPDISMHDFRMVEGKIHTNLIFDIAIPPRYKLSDSALRELFYEKVKALPEAYYCVITVDRSYTFTTKKQGE